MQQVIVILLVGACACVAADAGIWVFAAQGKWE